MFSLGLEPNSGPGLIFATLPKVFAAIPAGWLFGLLFFVGLFGAGYLSGIAAFEVLVAALTDNTRLSRRAVVWLVAGVAFLIAIPPMINNADLHPVGPHVRFGDADARCAGRGCDGRLGDDRAATRCSALSTGGERPVPSWLYLWIRWVIPGALLAVGVWWLVTDVLRLTGAA